MSKVFGIGMNKTGTRSLADAVRMLGFRALHKGDATTSAMVDLAAEEGRPLLADIGEQFDAYFDVSAIVHRFPQLDSQYPGSKFILTTRSLDGWLDSRERHVLANQRRAADGSYTGDWLTVDRRAWAEEWERHHDCVTRYFASRPADLLTFDVTAGDGWPQLAPFLGRAIPSRPFPWENRAGRGTYRPAGLWAGGRRRIATATWTARRSLRRR